MDKSIEIFKEYVKYLGFEDFLVLAKFLRVRVSDKEANVEMLQDIAEGKNKKEIDKKIKLRRDFEEMTEEMTAAYSKLNRERRRILISSLRKVAVHSKELLTAAKLSEIQKKTMMEQAALDATEIVEKLKTGEYKGYEVSPEKIEEISKEVEKAKEDISKNIE